MTDCPNTFCVLVIGLRGKAGTEVGWGCGQLSPGRFLTRAEELNSP